MTEQDRPSIRRLDERLGLSVLRCGLPATTLVTYSRDHVAVRTPSRPDLLDGNTLDLTGVPGPGDLHRHLVRYRETVGSLGARHLRLRWETPLEGDARPSRPDPDPALVAAAEDLGLTVSATTVLLLAEPVAPTVHAAVHLQPIPPPQGAGGGVVDRQWHASSVLYRYATGDTAAQWRPSGEDLTAWRVAQQRELAVAGRCQVYLALRHGIPVARLSLLHDRQGLAVVEDVVVHPAHRRRGIAAALTHRAVTDHLAALPGSRVGVGAEPAGVADRLYRRIGFRPHATVWTAERAADPAS